MLATIIPGYSTSRAMPPQQRLQGRKAALQVISSDCFTRTPRPLFSANQSDPISLGLIDVGSDKVMLRRGVISDFPAIAEVLTKILPTFDGEEGEGSPTAGSSILSYFLERPLGGEGDHHFEDGPRYALKHPDTSLFMAIVDKQDPDKVVGSVCLVPQTDERVETSQAAELTNFYLLPAYRGGTGKAVGNYVLHRAKGMRYQQVYLTTHRRFTAARALYHKLGFENLPKSLDEPPYDRETVSMMKRL
jgi:GNAT superfamily N-acetyltransferase